MGERPIAPVNHHYEWTSLYGFVHPHSGETEWFILPRVNTTWFNLALETFAAQVGVGTDKHILLVLDGAGWHRSKDLVVPEGIHLEILPPDSPELQPAERLWRLADEPLANQAFEQLEQLEQILEARCKTLTETMKPQIQALTDYYWWP